MLRHGAQKKIETYFRSKISGPLIDTLSYERTGFDGYRRSSSFYTPEWINYASQMPYPDVSFHIFMYEINEHDIYLIVQHPFLCIALISCISSLLGIKNSIEDILNILTAYLTVV